MMKKLTGSRTLMILFGLFLLLTAAFVVLGRLTQITWIDGMSDPGQVLAYVGTLSGQQKLIHSIVTATLDVAYPLVYGGLFAGLIRRYWTKWAGLLVMAAYAVIGVDLLEGVVQILILNGQIGLVGLKSWLTPLKMALFFLSMAIAVSGLVKNTVFNRKT